jgi:hypothetical protein
MAYNKIDSIIEKYFQGETSIAEEKELRSYFSTLNVAPHLEQYKAMFGFFDHAKQQEFSKELPEKVKTRKVIWLSIAASIAILLGLVPFFMIDSNTVAPQKELGSYNDPQRAFKETQKALALLSLQVNVGMESVMYVREYETAKKKVFK